MDEQLITIFYSVDGYTWYWARVSYSTLKDMQAIGLTILRDTRRVRRSMK